jgi:hypothetical protein
MSSSSSSICHLLNKSHHPEAEAVLCSCITSSDKEAAAAWSWRLDLGIDHLQVQKHFQGTALRRDRSHIKVTGCLLPPRYRTTALSLLPVLRPLHPLRDQPPPRLLSVHWQPAPPASPVTEAMPPPPFLTESPSSVPYHPPEASMSASPTASDNS